MFDEEYGVDASDLNPGGTLVVCPTSVLHQWHREIREKVNMRTGFSVHVYHGKVCVCYCVCVLIFCPTSVLH